MTVQQITDEEVAENTNQPVDNQTDDVDEVDGIDDGLEDDGDESPDDSPPSPKRKVKSKRGGPRPGSGRPRVHPLPEKKPLLKMTRVGEVDKRASFVSELPPPPSFEIASPDKFFAYVRSIPLDKLHRVTLAFYRYLPIVDMTEGGTKAKYIDIIPGESHQFHDEQWEKVILHLYGSGNYGCYLNEVNRAIVRCLKINTKWDLENYPPIIDPKTLDENHPNNKSYIQYLRQKGIQLPSQIDQSTIEEQKMQASAIETLTNTVANLASRQMTPVPQVQSAAEKLTLEGAAAVISMVKDNAHMNAQKDTTQADPITLVNTILSAAREMNGGGGNKGPDPVFMAILQDTQRRSEKLEERLWESQKEQNRLMERMMAPASSPPSMVDEFERLAKIKDAAKSLFGGGEEEAPTPHGSGGWKQMLAENLPVLVQGAFGLVDRFQSAAVSIAAANAAAKAGIPVQQAVAQAQATAAASNPQPEQPPINVPPGMNIEQLRQYHHMLGSITGPILNHMRDEQNGHTFAEWFIGGNGMIAYRRVAGLGKEQKPDGKIAVNIEPLMTVIKTYPPLWNEVGVIEPEFRQFLTQFIEFGDLPEEGEGEEDAEEKGVDEDEEVIA